MEHGHPVAPSNSAVLDHHPPQEPTTGDEEQHHEKKSIMSRVHNKVNKLKHTINKKRHTQDEAAEVPPEEENEEFDENNGDMDVDSEVSSTHAVYDSPSRDLDDQHEPLITPETVKPHDGRDETPVMPETVLDGRHEPPVPKDSRHEPPVPPAAVYDSPAASREFDREHEPLNRPETVKPHVLDGRDETPVTPETVPRGRPEPPVTPEEEPIAPLPYGSVPPTTDDADTGLPTSVGPTPGNESSVPPEVLSSLRSMSLSEKREGQLRDQPPSETQPGPEDETSVNHMSSDMEKQPSYNEKLDTTAAASKEAPVSAESTEYPAGTVSGPTGTPPKGVEKEMKPSYSKQLSSSAFAAKDAAVAAASKVYGKVAGKEGTHSSETRGEVVSPVSTVANSEEGAGEKKGSYTEKLSGTALAAKDAAVNAASTVYGIVVGAGATVMGNVVEPESVREYLAEKLRPGEEDKALCEVISGSMKKGGEEDKGAVEKGRIELPEVTSREVVSDAPAEAITDAPPAVDAKSGGYTGQGMVEKIRGSVTSLVGGKGGVADPPAEGVSDAPAAVDAKSGGYTGQGMVEKIRGSVPSIVGDRGGVADAPEEAVSDAPPAVNAKSGGYTGQGMVEKIRGYVPSIVGGRGGVADAPEEAVSDAPPAVDAKSGGYMGKIRGAVTSLVGGRGGVADAPASAVEAPSGGTTDSPAAASSGDGRGEVADTPAAVAEAPSGGAGK